jgi:structure-specific endonuclease subunit SLX1
MSSNFYVYLLESTSHATYVGATVNLAHRLRQHNGELKGGARATTMKVNKGETWRRVCYVEGFPTWPEALKFEWAWKFYSRKLSKKLYPLHRRKQALENLMALERSTSKAIAYSDWETPIHVVWEQVI